MSSLVSLFHRIKQYTIWCIVFSLGLVFFSVGNFTFSNTSVTTLTLSVAYSVSGELSVIGPSGIINSGDTYYVSGDVVFGLSSTDDVNYTLFSSRGTILDDGFFVSPFSTGYSFISGDDGFFTATGIIETSSGFYFPYNSVDLFKDSTPPVIGGPRTYTGSSIFNELTFSWAPAVDTGVGGVFYTLSMKGVSGPASGMNLYVPMSSTSIVFPSNMFYPGSYEIGISALDLLYNQATYTPTTTIVLEDNPVVSTTQVSQGGGGGGSVFYDICLCGDFSGSPLDYRCSPGGYDEADYSVNFCTFISSEQSGGNMSQEFLEQWPDLTDRFLHVVGGLPADLGLASSIQLPGAQVIYSRYESDFWNKLHIVLQKEEVSESLFVDRPFVQGELDDGILYITYIDKPDVKSYLCVNCCHTVSFALRVSHIKDIIWYLWWCRPLLLLLLLVLLLSIIYFSYKKKEKVK